MAAWMSRLVATLAALPLSAAPASFPAPGVNVLVFVRTDCPITNRYAPELARIAQRFSTPRGAAQTPREPVAFWLVYADKRETDVSIAAHKATYELPGAVLRDADGALRRRGHVTIAPEAAVFDAAGVLRYHGRIDDRYLSVGRARPGGATVHDLEDAIAAIENGQPVRQSETKAFGCFLSDVD